MELDKLQPLERDEQWQDDSERFHQELSCYCTQCNSSMTEFEFEASNGICAECLIQAYKDNQNDEELEQQKERDAVNERMQ